MTTARALRGPFDYRLPEELRDGVDVGSMLVVPFGKREILGVVVGLADSSDVAEEKLLAPLRALELGVPVDLVALAEWIAAEKKKSRELAAACEKNTGPALAHIDTINAAADMDVIRAALGDSNLNFLG